MKITINYTKECKKQVFVETGKVIDKVTVEIDPTTLSPEEREMLLRETLDNSDYGRAPYEERKMKHDFAEYTDDVMGMIRRDAAAYKETLAKSVELARKENEKGLKLWISTYKEINVEYYQAAVLGSWFPYVAGCDYSRAFSKSVNDIADATREDIEKMVTIEYTNTGVDNEDLRRRMVDAIIEKRDELVAKKLAEEAKKAEEKAREAHEKQEKEARDAERDEKRKAWREANGSNYLKNLLHEGMAWQPVFFKEYETAELVRIKIAADIDGSIYDEDDYEDGNGSEYYVKDFDLSEVTLSEGMMAVYLCVKDVAGFVSAKWVRVKHEYYGEHQWTKRFLVAKFETELDTYEVKLTNIKPTNK